MKKVFLVMLAVMTVFMVMGCEEDSGTNAVDTPSDLIVGKWLSTGDNVAPLLATFFAYDSVRVEFKDDMSVVLESHVANGAWTTQSGTYVVTESEDGDVHTINLIYSAFEQQGIFQITGGDPDMFQLEAVQTNPDIGATPRTPESGFGSDTSLGSSNIQKYVRIQ